MSRDGWQFDTSDAAWRFLDRVTQAGYYDYGDALPRQTASGLWYVRLLDWYEHHIDDLSALASLEGGTSLSDGTRSVSESKHMTDHIRTLSGADVVWGTDEHINDLRTTINSLSVWRDAQRRGSSKRADYQRMINRLKGELRSVERFVSKTQ